MEWSARSCEPRAVGLCSCARRAQINESICTRTDVFVRVRAPGVQKGHTAAERSAQAAAGI